MRIVVNGEHRDFGASMTVAEMLAELGMKQNGIAVAVDDVVVRRGEWDSVSVSDGAKLEILTAVQGG